MKVKYIKDIDYDSEILWIMLSSPDPAGNKNRATSMGLEMNTYEKIAKAEDYKDIKDFILKLVEEKYKENSITISKAPALYQKAWNKINDKFSDNIEKITNTKWHHDTFFVVLSPFHIGVSNTGGDKVIRSIFEDPEDQKRITAHEILMSHIWNIMFDSFGDKAKQDSYMHYWGLNEIATTAVLGLESEMNDLWTQNYKGYDNYLGNYPQLKKLQNKMKDVYLAKNSFTDFLNEGISIIESEYKEIPLYLI